MGRSNIDLSKECTNSISVQRNSKFRTSLKLRGPMSFILSRFVHCRILPREFPKHCCFVGTFQDLNVTYLLIIQFSENTLSYESTAHGFVPRRQLNFIFIVPADVTRIILTEFLTYDNTIAFSIAIYKYFVFLTCSLSVATRVFDDMNGNKCGKRIRMEWIRAMQCVSNTLLKHTFLSFCRFAIRVIGRWSICIQAWREGKPSRHWINWIKKKRNWIDNLFRVLHNSK